MTGIVRVLALAVWVAPFLLYVFVIGLTLGVGLVIGGGILALADASRE